MKKLIISLFFITLISLFAEWRNSLAPEGDKVTVNLREFTSIVMANPADEREKFAAKLLGEILEELTGQKLQTAGNANGKAFRFGKIAPELGESGYRISIADNGDIVLCGGTRRGVINAVVALLEEDIGVRWYAAKGFCVTRIPFGG